MKKIQLVAFALLASVGMSAENTTKLRVWIGGEKTEYELSMVDSLTFFTNTDDEPAAPDEPAEPDEPTDPEAPLAGVFSVSAAKQVKFSKGNLQHTRSTKTWAFAEHQYDMIGVANEANYALADKIDFFGWSGSTGAAMWGVSTSTSYSDYSGNDFADWGKIIGDGTTWRTLTNEEWIYLRTTRANAASLMGVARIQISAEQYANGLILLPDNWTCPEDITFKSGFASESSEQAYADYQTFTLEQWQKLEAAGAVFLPASGYRLRWLVSNVQLDGSYWSATPDSSFDGYACHLFFYSNRAGWEGYDRSYGQAVRLVQDL